MARRSANHAEELATTPSHATTHAVPNWQHRASMQSHEQHYFRLVAEEPFSANWDPDFARNIRSVKQQPFAGRPFDGTAA